MVNSAEAGHLFQRYWPEQATGEVAATENAAGLSDTALFRVESAQGAYALRGWQRGRVVQAERVATVLHFVGRDRPGWVPAPVPSSGPEAPLLVVAEGYAWQLEPWLPGASDWQREANVARLESAARNLAEFHLVAGEFSVPRAGSFRNWESETVSPEEHLSRLRQQLDCGTYREVAAPPGTDGWPRGAPAPEFALRKGVEIAEKLLLADLHEASRRQVCWGDAWHDNFLFCDDEVSGLVDFASMRIDSPLMDLSRLLGSTCAEHPEWRERGLAAYTGIRPLSAGDCRRVVALEAVGTVVSLANWIRWLWLERREFRHPAAAQQRLEHFLLRTALLLGWPIAPR